MMIMVKVMVNGMADWDLVVMVMDGWWMDFLGRSWLSW